MGAEIRIYEIGNAWALMPSAHGFFVNNGNVDLYVQQQSGSAPAANDAGVRIRPGNSFFVSHELYKITYLRTLSGTTTIANYENRNNGAGTTSLIDPLSGNSATINELGQLHTVMRAEVDAENSTKTPLVADEEFIGEWRETLDYAEIGITTYSDVASAVDGLCLEFSSDGITVHGCGDNYTLIAGAEKTFSFQPQRRYYRVKYTNGAIDQTVFDLETILHKTRCKPSSHRVQDSIADEDDAELVKAVIAGKTPQGIFTNFQATRRGNFKVAVEEYGDTPAVDAFSRLRVSNPYTLFDSKQLHDKSPLFWDESLGGAASSTHSTIDARTRLEVTANAADFAIRQTKMRFNYQPAKGQLVFMTLKNEHVAGLTKRIGMFDGTGTNNLTPNNGIFYETNNGVSWNIAKNGTVTEHFTQANWNCDTMDGSGDEGNPSGILLDTAAPAILVLDFEWLGVGRVRVGFVINGLIYYVHKFNHANISAFNSVYMSTPNLPLRYDIQTDGTAAGFIDHICSSVMSEGGQQDNGVIRYASTAGTHIDANTENTIYALIGIRLKAAYKDISLKLLNAAVQLQTGSHKVEWILKLNPTIAGTFTYADQTDSAAQIARGATVNTVTGGYDIAGGFIESGGAQSGNSGSGGRGIENAVLLGSKIDGTMDTIVLCARPIGGSANVDIEASINWRELL